MTGTKNTAPGVPGNGGQDTGLSGSVDAWLTTLREAPALGALLAPPWPEQLARGYGHTLREICQQPLTWQDTAARLRRAAGPVAESLRGVRAVVFTGSGSSLYAGECVAPALQAELGLPVSAVAAGLVLTHPASCLPPFGPFLVVSVARSGNSPESRAVVDWLLESRPDARHLVLTCNGQGALATASAARTGVRAVVLDETTDDRSLVMTSSFTNLVLAGRALASLAEPEQGSARFEALARAGSQLLLARTSALAELARSGFTSAVFLGSGCRLGSAREAALKILEMNGGEVWTLAESYLGLRHGPMSAIRKDTLIVAFLSSDPLVRAYELDVLRELDRKGIGGRRLVLGASLPVDLGGVHPTLAIDCVEAEASDDAELTVLDATVGQLLGFFRCLAAGFKPDSPSELGVITRVVSGFEIHSRNAAR
jgi:tagatose-6-phosphate ketose/aldose isomerase